MIANITRCLLCNKEYEHVHHIFFGAGKRKLSEKYNLKIPLCHYCHNLCHGKYKSFKKYNFNYKKYCQRIICKKLKISFYKINILFNNSSYLEIDEYAIEYMGLIKKKMDYYWKNKF